MGEARFTLVSRQSSDWTWPQSDRRKVQIPWRPQVAGEQGQEQGPARNGDFNGVCPRGGGGRGIGGWSKEGVFMRL